MPTRRAPTGSKKQEAIMAPEEVYRLIALMMRTDGHRLLANGEIVSRPDGLPIYVSWYRKSPANSQVAIAGGLVHVPITPRLARDEIRDMAPADLGDGYFKWREPPPEEGPLMFAMSLPPGYTLTKSEPKPVEAKDYEDKIAVFWILPPKNQISLKWQIGEIRGDLIEEIRRINRDGLDQLLPARDGGFEYDVALSFTGEDRTYVERVATLLKEAGVKVFYDRFEEASLWGKNLYDHLSDVYGRQARYTVMFISRHYVEKRWTSHERASAQERALQENLEYILPVRFDDTRVPGLPSTVAYLSLEGREPKNLAALIIEKLAL